MQVLTKYFGITVVLILLLCSCKKEAEVRYELNEIAITPSNAVKDKLKTNEQYVAILYANLFQTALSANDLFDLNKAIESIGDKQLAREVIISNFMNNDNVQLPSVEEMNADIDNFIDNTYIRFFVRYPNEAEKTWMRNFIQSNPYMTPELVYFSFALSDEYLYY